MPEIELEAIERDILDRLGVAEQTEKKEQQTILNFLQKSIEVSEESSKVDEIKNYLQLIWENNPYKNKSEEEQEEFHKKAKRIVFERREILKGVWREVEELRPYLAFYLLEELKSGKKKIANVNERNNADDFILKIDIENITDEQIEFFEKHTIDCQKCNHSIEKCLENKTEIIQKLKKDNKVIQQLWSNEKELQPCIASVIIEQFESVLL